VFINLNDSNWRLDKNLFVPFGVVNEGMSTFDSIYAGYGQEPEQVVGRASVIFHKRIAAHVMRASLQELIYSHGFAYLSSSFPLLSYTMAGVHVISRDGPDLRFALMPTAVDVRPSLPWPRSKV
jgi:hypothetical protein